MRDVVDPVAVRYADEHSTAPPAYLSAVEETTRRDFPAWGMMVGRQEGRFLGLLVFATNARSVLEIGTFTGYSAIAMASGLSSGGKIQTCEVDPHHAATARRNIEASPYADRIEILEGPALESIARLSGPFDLVFIDADKAGYDAYFEAVLPKLASRGLILADNTLYHGEVLEDVASDPNAAALKRFNDKLVADPRVVCALTTIRDGVTLIRRADAGLGEEPVILG
ncbi:MAG: class I SAM-dependent methyltransferase [Actinomycetota bacterium]|nr:class I SAM-dependent methyltransferase [Actinomycetota bacterium]